MSRTSFAPAGPIKGVRSIAVALMAAGALAVGLLGPAVSSADTGGNSCSYVTVGSILNITCNGQVNDVPVTVNIGNVASDNNLNVLSNNLNDAYAAVANISDINILSADLNAAVQTIANTVVTTTTTTTTKTCTVAVTPPATATQTSTITIACS
jgi:hypothetical protein